MERHVRFSRMKVVGSGRLVQRSAFRENPEPRDPNQTDNEKNAANDSQRVDHAILRKLTGTHLGSGILVWWTGRNTIQESREQK